MDLTSAKDNTSNNDIEKFRKKLQEKIQQIMDRTTVIHPPIEIPYPLPPFKLDDTNLEKLEWIIPPIPVDLNDYVPEVDVEALEKLADECRKEV